MSLITSSSASNKLNSNVKKFNLNGFKNWLLIALIFCLLAVSSSQAYEIRSFEVDGYPRDDYLTGGRNPLNLYRLMKRAAVKRERIIMDAMGGDYLVKRSVY